MARVVALIDRVETLSPARALAADLVCSSPMSSTASATALAAAVCLAEDFSAARAASTYSRSIRSSCA
ncbi:Uncharacterised protein [Mycobacteroides abscessus subsp. abscessus]|nr:Uncharacterised protein [Mycobacteroides abscessus subsp. abscessus]